MGNTEAQEHLSTSVNSLARVFVWLRARPLVVDALLAVGVAALFFPWSLSLASRTMRLPWLLVLALALLAGHGALTIRRVAPLRSFAAVCLVALIVALIPGAPAVPPSLMVFPLSLYATCAYAAQRWAPALGLAVGAVGAGVLTLQMTFTGQLPGQFMPLMLYGTLLAVALAGWSLGMFRRVQRAYIAALKERAARAEADREERARRAVLEERARIAREMHDVVAHSLAVIVSQAQGGQYAAQAQPERAAQTLATIATAGRQALADMRGLLGVLRGDSSVSSSPSASGDWAPQPSLADLPALLDSVRAAGLPVAYTTVGEAYPLSPAAELAFYRMTQEGLTNTLKHAGPGASADLRFDWAADGLAVTLRDNGRGATQAAGSVGLGLVGMRERLAAVGASLTAGPAPEGGYVVRAWAPRAEAPVAASGASVSWKEPME